MHARAVLSSPPGLTPLHIAALENDVDTVKRLLRLKADAGQFALGVCAGKTALGTAVASGSKEVAAYLQSLQIKMAKVPQTYAQRYLRMNRFVPVEVSERGGWHGQTYNR